MIKKIFSVLVSSFIITQVALASPLLQDERETLHPSSEKNIELHLMWLNDRHQPDYEGLFRTAEDKHQKILVDYVVKNEDLLFPVNVWYDGHTTSSDQIGYTQNKIFETLEQKGVSPQKIQFKDIWEMPYVKNHPNAFSQNHPVYFRADLARIPVLLQKDYPAGQSPRYRIYSDLNIAPVSMSSLFTGNAVWELPKILENHGFALSENQAGDLSYAYENAFCVLDWNNKEAVHGLGFAVLEINRLRAEYFHKMNTWGLLTEAEKHKLTQVIFASYKLMFLYNKYLKGECGINDCQENMPQSLEGRIDLYQNPQDLFDFLKCKSTVTYKESKVKSVDRFVGGRYAGKTFNGVPVSEDGYITETVHEVVEVPATRGREYVIDVKKPISSFYTHST